MDTSLIKKILRFVAGLSLIVPVIQIYCFDPPTLCWNTVYSLITTFVSIASAVFIVFIKWAWKFPLFRWWLGVVNLNGTWKGTIKTTWVDPKTNKVPDPIDAMLTIRQNLLNITCVMITKQMRGGIADRAILINNKETKLCQVHYIYNTDPYATANPTNLSHKGACILHIQEDKILKGTYWTDRKTTGDIEMEFYSKK